MLPAFIVKYLLTLHVVHVTTVYSDSRRLELLLSSLLLDLTDIVLYTCWTWKTSR